MPLKFASKLLENFGSDSMDNEVQNWFRENRKLFGDDNIVGAPQFYSPGRSRNTYIMVTYRERDAALRSADLGGDFR